MNSIIFLLSRIITLKITLTVSIVTLNEIQSISNLKQKDALSLFHLNTCPLSKNIEEREYLISKTLIDFDVIGISKSRIK